MNATVKARLVKDVVDNGEFDDEERAWRLSSGKVEFVEEEKYEATNRFARIPHTDALFQEVPLVPGHAYILEFHHRGLAGGTVSIKRSGENDPTHYEKSIPQTTGSTWNRFLDTFAVGSDWSPRLMIHFRAGSIPGQYVDIDKVMLYDQTAGEPV